MDHRDANEFLYLFHLTFGPSVSVGYEKMQQGIMETEGGNTVFPRPLPKMANCAGHLSTGLPRTYEWFVYRPFASWHSFFLAPPPPLSFLLLLSLFTSMHTWLTTSIIHYSANEAESDQACCERHLILHLAFYNNIPESPEAQNLNWKTKTWCTCTFRVSNHS